MISKIRTVVQVLFLLLFLFLMVAGKAQFWMGFIFLSILLAPFFGRLYCGWACPINTLFRPLIWIKQKLKLTQTKLPEILKTERPRWILFGLFSIGLIYTIYTITQGRKFPLPLIIIPLGLLTLIFSNEKAWHRYLCPWGVLFSLTGRFKKGGFRATSSCRSCSICSQNCPGEAIQIKPGQGVVIDPTFCLQCFECQVNCPVQAISYKFSEKGYQHDIAPSKSLK